MRARRVCVGRRRQGDAPVRNSRDKHFEADEEVLQPAGDAGGGVGPDFVDEVEVHEPGDHDRLPERHEEDGLDAEELGHGRKRGCTCACGHRSTRRRGRERGEGSGRSGGPRTQLLLERQIEHGEPVEGVGDGGVHDEGEVCVAAAGARRRGGQVHVSQGQPSKAVVAASAAAHRSGRSSPSP